MDPERVGLPGGQPEGRPDGFPATMAMQGILAQAVGMQCHACQTVIPLASGESVGFRDVCDRCHADLHVCLNCAHHDPSAYNECRESSAERVLDHDRANRCDYFRPGARVASGVDDRDRAMADLESLFRKD